MDYNITYRQKDKGWQCIISYKNYLGKWKQKSKQGFKSKKEAKSYSIKIVESLKQNHKLNSEFEGITFQEFTSIYLEHISLHYEFSTLRNYKLSLKKFSNLNSKELIKITPIDIQNCVDSMIKSDLNSSTIINYLTRIKAIFNSAKNKYKIINENPVSNIEIKTKKKPTEKKALTESELKRLLALTKNIKYKVVFSLAGMCGLRFGEIQGLKWNKINFKDNTIIIDTQWKSLGNGKCGFGPLKSSNSYRTIPLPPFVKNTLLEWKSIQIVDITNRVIVYKSYNGGNNAILNDYIRKLGFDITLHELRHTYATTLISKGIDFKTVAKLMGHDIEETMKIYSHVTDTMMENATKIINSMF